ncbi:cell envelope protein SmpA [Rickettsia bellii]|uniref:TmRNA-binding protein n=3 Tax=Rickettsia bellii TaxID=33990 RepID=Q1RKA7_RICBR|nr:outer membrane protein assembly factor BamE [Rickettsia bellii]ABE04207.1 tmRNA-binding protein [Rickettsia bellii RML369-C]ABV79758.1 tmRNA-binding protein [Rickettsia bellii OSU 85-389]ARD85916.1 cell envelope protein SmpA [Rickettsia bellii]KJV90647.1 smpA / OmlA family protein [Rickettsia bellii str. RML An4]KJV92480.1 smpA / OmlA family protein [Rickettsia bellii str. RML Mogi]
MKFFLIFVSTIFVIFSLSGCQTIENRGQSIDDSALTKLEAKKLSKTEVVELIGTPTMIPEYSQDTWYYVERVMSQRAWLNPKIVKQRIVKITFDSRNLMQEIVVIDDSHRHDIETISEYTKTYGTELNGLQKFVKNLGRFNKTTGGNKNKNKSKKKK